jgi:uncharacterized membrane-anchored protein YjiN (DUF445 family)
MEESALLQRRQLRRYRTYATLLLIAAAGLYLLTRLALPPSTWTELLRAGSEAAMVGGLADWFAVTALFRRPLGLPIPHTAVIPANKDRIGEGLGRFVERHFLEPEVVGRKLRSLNLAERLAEALADPAKAQALAGRIASLAPYLMRTAGDASLRRFLGEALQQELSRVDLPGLLGRTLDLLYRSDRHHLLLDRLLLTARRWLEGNREEALRLVEEKSRWWIPRRIDKRIAEVLVNSTIELLGDLLERDHSLRQRFDQAVRTYIEELKSDPERRAGVERFFKETLAQRRTAAYLGRLWRGLRQRLEEDLELPDSLVRRTLTQGLQSLGRALQRDVAMLERVNHRIEVGATDLIVPWRGEIGRFIAEVVKGWESRDVVERIELAVGRDLQYIRMNGTLVGALVGCAIYGLGRAFGW